MIRLLEYLYYCTYLFGSILNPKKSREWLDVYHERAWLVLSVTVLFLSMTCLTFFSVAFSVKQVKPYANMLAAIIVLFTILSFGLTYYYLFSKKNSERIIDSYIKSRSNKIILDLIFGILYFILGILSLPAAIFFIDHFHLRKI